MVSGWKSVLPEKKIRRPSTPPTLIRRRVDVKFGGNPNPMSYSTLHRALLDMQAHGEGGFEGLTAALLERMVGDRFIVARSGSQPADAISRTGIAIQTKRYDKTSFDETKFEGEFSRACRQIDGLDIYVFASTREHAQLEVLSRQLEEREGVDIFLLSAVGDESPLAALCVIHWQTVRRFFGTDELSLALDAWAAREAARPEIQERVARLRADFQHFVHTAESTRRRLAGFHARRFGLDPAQAGPTRFSIELPRSVVRHKPVRALDAWWQDASRPAAVLTAEEGMGKSWVAAAFARHLAATTPALVLWLDSADWTGRRSLREVVETSLRLAGISDERLVVRLARKALGQWRQRLLIVLDGVNERGARQTAHHLLAELFSLPAVAARLLFTTRPTTWAADERGLWNSAQTVPLERFTEAEFCDALQSLPDPIARAEVPDGLAEIARIPRYFHRALKLRERFRSFANVSKEMVLWADLLEKIDAQDPQVAGTIAWTSQADARRQLLKLADSAGQIRHADPAERHYQMLLQVFGEGYAAVRHDLAEQRIVLDPAGDHPRPNLAHIRLGFALLIGRFLHQHGETEVGALADAISAQLEPLSSQDDVTEALFVALQLSALPDPGPTLVFNGKQRAALLLAWSNAHNARVEQSRLHFWMREDEPAYLDFLETAFIQPVSEPWMNDLLAAISGAWRDAPDPASALAGRLRRWLKLVWYGPGTVLSNGYVAEGIEWPLAKTKSQLILSRIALAVLSEAPASDEFLYDLILAWASGRLCWEQRFLQEREGQPRQEFLVYCKELHRNLGPYFRWRYTERVKEALVTLKAANPTIEAVVRACDEIIESFDTFGTRWQNDPETELLAGASFFMDAAEGAHGRFYDCAHLAVREDLPRFSPADSDWIARIMEAAFASPQFHSGRELTGMDMEARQYLAWFARYHPQRLLELGSQFRLTALGRGEQFGVVDFANTLPYSATLVPSSALLEASKGMVARVLAQVDRDCRWVLKSVHVLAVTCFSEQDLAEWFEFASEHLALRREYHYYPMPLLIPRLCSRRLVNGALRRAVEWADRHEAISATDPDSVFEFWADVAGRSSDPDLEISRQISRHLEACPRGNWRRFHLLMIYFRSLPDDAIAEAFASGDILRYLDLEGWRALRMSQRRDLPWTRLPRDFETVLDHGGTNAAGALFQLAGHTPELGRWGELLFAKARQVLGEQVPERQFWGRTVHFTDRQGYVIGSTCDREDVPAPDAQPALRLNHHAAPAGFLFQERDIEQREAATNDAIQTWIQDTRRLEDIPAGVLYEFQSSEALVAFRDLAPVRFRELATTLLGAILAKPERASHAGSFAHFVAAALVPLDPSLAIAAAREMREGFFRHDVINEYGVSLSEATAWSAAAQGNVWCESYCRRVLESAKDDAQLLKCAITAQAEGAGPWLASYCDDLLTRPSAKDRCLAVSLLPWMVDPSPRERLGNLAQSDPSGWMRTHAAWALQVARQENAAQDCYRRVLAAQTAADAQTWLEVMRPALTWTAGWWRQEIEIELGVAETVDDAVLAAMLLFWDGINSHKGEGPNLYGRKLAEYLRGEKIADLRAPSIRLQATEDELADFPLG